MTPEDIASFLRAVVARPSTSTVEEVREALAQRKREAVAAADQALAKGIWCSEQALTVQEHYLAAFRLLQERAFYGA
jgi:hypothetical protein